MSDPGRTRRRETGAALAAALLFAVWGAAGVSMDRSMGWDESMHAAWPAARIALHLGEGELAGAARAAVECQRYPFVWPAVLGVVQLFAGVSELACRAAGRVAWGAGVFGLFLLGRALVEGIARRRGAPGRGDRLAPWLAMALGASSPLALSFSGTLFLEMPFVVAAIFALHAWLSRAGALGREVRAGAWLAVALFAKFNYGLLLGFGCALAWALEGLEELRAGRGAAYGRRTLALAALPAAACLWWFVLPLPAGTAMGASHREALLAFLGENRDPSMATPWSMRIVHWACSFARTPRTLVVLLVGVFASGACLRAREARALWVVLLALAAPIALHPFHLDRFHLAQGPALWVLGGLGIARLLPARRGARAAAIAVLLLGTQLAPARDAWWLMERVGLAREDVREVQLGILADFRSLAPGRPLETNGLARAGGGRDRVGWIGMSQSFAPGALFLGLLERGRDVRRAVLEDPLDRAFVTLGVVDPGWEDARLVDWARQFDLLLATRPPNLRASAGREFLTGYQTRLLATGEWAARELGVLSVVRPNGEALEVWVYAIR